MTPQIQPRPGIVTTAPIAHADMARRRVVPVTYPDGRRADIVTCHRPGLVQAAVWIGSGPTGAIARAAEATGIERSVVALLLRRARPYGNASPRPS